VKTTIYYFTGTGNSLATARKIAAALGETQLVPIASLMNTPSDITPEAERVGVVCPVYFSGLPLIVASFAERLDTGAARYMFAVLTHGGGGESAALRQLDSILRKKEGRGLDAGFGVTMPGNYIMMYESPMGQKQQEILANSDIAVAAIAGSIARMEKADLPTSLINRILYTLIYPWFRSHARTDDKKFSVTDACTSCGTCVAVCPAKNIELVNKKPAWKHRCELCCACIHTCPAKAIQAGARTEKWGRYRHPDVPVAELKIQKENTP
jgi:ferredoxin